MSAGSVAKHDRADFAQEFLRRNAAYRAAWTRASGQPEGAADTRDIAAIWGLEQLFDPARAVRTAPAIWLANAASQVVTLVPAPTGFAGAIVLPTLSPAAQMMRGSEQNFVLDRAGVRHRLRLMTSDPIAPFAILLPPISDAIQAAACDAARRMFAGLATAEVAGQLRPSALQQQRLALLLGVLDASLRGATNREIGAEIVYPWLAGADAVAWKSTGERRRVQRLLAEARHLSTTGYRALLKP